MEPKNLKRIRKSKTYYIVRKYIKFEKTPYKLLIIGAIVGSLTGFTCAIFQILPNYILSLKEELFIFDYSSIFIVSGIMASLAAYITFKIAPEAGGSGIPEIEGALDNKRKVRWKRVLPVKLIGGILSLSSGMILGREGPSIQIGGNIGKMISDILYISQKNGKSLLAAGSAAGLAAAFNAPLAGILFVLEELRPQFKYSFISIKIVSITVIFASISRYVIIDNNPTFNTLPNFVSPEISNYIGFIFLGTISGLAAYFFNKCVNYFQDLFLKIHQNKIPRILPIVFILAGIFGVLSVLYPDASGSGIRSIPKWIINDSILNSLLLLVIWRFFGTIICFSSGVPGGIFAPSLAIGSLLGLIVGILSNYIGLTNCEPGIYAIAGMAALFAGSVRAPVTGIILVTEMTNNYQFILPLMLTTFFSTITAQALGGKPIYTQILERTLKLNNNKNI